MKSIDQLASDLANATQRDGITRGTSLALEIELNAEHTRQRIANALERLADHCDTMAPKPSNLVGGEHAAL